MTGINHLKLERKYRRDSGKKGVVINRVKEKKARKKKKTEEMKKKRERVMSPT